MEVQAENDEKTFIVTQMINPSYFHLFNPYLRDDKARNALEENLISEIQNFGYKNSTERKHKKGDIVAYYWEDGKRYIRCEIDDVIMFNYSYHYFLFALDYGVSLFTTRAEDINPISEIIKFSKSPIMNKVALNILPAVTRFDYLNEKEEILFHNSWCPLALKLFQQSLDKASVISFEMSDNLTNHKGFLFGDLIITTFYGLQFSLSQVLVNEKVAKRASSPEEFEKYFNRVLERDIERWNDNSKTGGILKYEEGKLPLNYDDEIQIKQYISNCEPVQSRKMSVQKVIEWQQKNEMYSQIFPNEESDDTSNEKDDEGFDDTFVNSKRKTGFKLEPNQSKLVTKKLKCDNLDESIVSGISRSVSQMFN
ncbi:unnamed protein product [Chironomus riparius]|uniref:Tudor domain-containing protein n=1 Tax=Chironomus riparius TaxID=315576 RepID=A0A9N9WMU8_9DIPT|nr:unnamed protein product [Chironomus riparius]